MAATRERAERIIDFWLNDKTPDFKIRSNIEHEIAAAIEEEREACAGVLDEESADMDGLASHSQQAEHWETMSGARMTAKKLRKCAEKIRARKTNGG